MTHIFESIGSSDDSPMRLNGSSASSASVASRLYTRSRRDSLGSDPELISFSDSEMHEIGNLGNQVTNLTKKLSEMEERENRERQMNDERSRLKTDNAVLTERVHVLEEQMHTIENRYKEQLQEEKARSRELVSRMERERQLEMESVNLKYQMIEKDLQTSKKETEKMRQDSAKAKENVEELKQQLAESKFLVEDLEEERLKLERQFKRFKEEAQQDIDSSSEMVEVLQLQTEELKKRAGGPRTGSMAEQMFDLEEELDRARQEVRQLQLERDDLQAQLLCTSIERGRSLLADEPSLADELVGGDSQQLLEALREQEVCNQKLRVYINGILMRVIERHPEILEINEKEGGEGHS